MTLRWFPSSGRPCAASQSWRASRVPEQIKEYVNAFFGAVDAAKVMKECDGYSIAEWFASKDK